MVTATVATDLKANFKYYMDRAADDDSIIITRPKHKNAVLIGEDEYNDLLRAKNNAEYFEKLNRSIDQAKEGNVVVKSIEELEAMADE